MDSSQPQDSLTQKINHQVNEIVLQRNREFTNTLIKILGLFFAVITIIAIIIAASYDDYLNAIVSEKAENEVKEALIPSINKTVNEVVNKTLKDAASDFAKSAVKDALIAYQDTLDSYRFDADVTSLNLRMQELDRSLGFSTKEAEEIISRIISLVSRADEKEFSKLEYSLETAVKNFASADALDLVSRLEDIAPDWFRNSGIVIQTMVHTLGLELLGDNRPISAWTETTGSKFGIYEDYRTYVDRARRNGYPELYLLYEMLLEDIRKQPRGVIENLIGDADDLNALDTSNFIKVMSALATEEMMRESTPKSRRVANRVKTFLCKYIDQGSLLPTVYRQVELDADVCMASGT